MRGVLPSYAGALALVAVVVLIVAVRTAQARRRRRRARTTLQEDLEALRSAARQVQYAVGLALVPTLGRAVVAFNDFARATAALQAKLAMTPSQVRRLRVFGRTVPITAEEILSAVDQAFGR